MIYKWAWTSDLLTRTGVVTDGEPQLGAAGEDA